MAVPWLQIVKLAPSILEVSRELLRRAPGARPSTDPGAPESSIDLAMRIAALEENERRQAELVSQMAEQIAVLTRAVTSLHRRTTWLTIGLGITLLVALVALAVALQN